MEERTYIAIDLKSFYASVECIERGVNPLTTHLVVADRSRTEKTICLAVTPSLKRYGIPGRARLFEVVQKVREINALRLGQAPGRKFQGKSVNEPELRSDPSLEVDFIVAPPRMAEYIKWSTRVYQIYLKYVAPEDIHVYSIDEVFMDVTNYLDSYRLTGEELARKILLDVLNTTGLTATAGIGTNLFLSKVALDITSKHIKPDRKGVCIARLDEMTFRRTMWSHRPLTDFWRVGRGYAKKLEESGLYTLGDVARCSVHNEDLLYRLFGVNAELLIDHAWGWEPCTIREIKAYKPVSKSVGSGQVLQYPYDYEGAYLVIREMAEQLALDLVERGLVTDQIVLTVGYDMESLSKGPEYNGPVTVDHYGRKVPKQAHGSELLGRYSSSTREILGAVRMLYERIIDPTLLVRRVNLVAAHVIPETDISVESNFDQLDLFTDYDSLCRQKESEAAGKERERRMQQTMLHIKKKYGKNAILKGMDLEKGATTIQRNGQIGGHRA